jgi:hypothetical protein
MRLVGMRVWVRWVVVAVALACGCKSGAPKPYDMTGANYCSGDADCVERCHGDPGCLRGFCAATVDPSSGVALSFCSKPCTQDADCVSDLFPASLACGVLADGSRGCVLRCAGTATTGFACVDGVPTDCQLAPETFCDVCGCPANLRCVSGVGCQPKAVLGEPCRYDDDCNTNHCSDVAGVCRTPVGQPCTDQNCDVCLSTQGGWSYCSRYCDRASCSDGLCLSQLGINTCWPRCNGPADASCPGRCGSVTRLGGGLDYYCDCNRGSVTCSQTGVPRANGQLCENGGQCASGACDTVPIECELSSCGYQGQCTTPCSSTAPCAAGFTCIATTCTGDDCGVCAPLCATSTDCQAGTCRPVATADGQSLLACDVSRDTGGLCTSGFHCLSGVCSSQRCTPAAGFPNGSSCSRPAECASQSCIASRCRGSGLAGDACGTSDDCAVGGCCTAGAAAGTCSTAC